MGDAGVSPPDRHLAELIEQRRSRRVHTVAHRRQWRRQQRRRDRLAGFEQRNGGAVELGERDAEDFVDFDGIGQKKAAMAGSADAENLVDKASGKR